MKLSVGNKKNKNVFCIIIPMILLLSACASPKPKIYPNKHYNEVGKIQADKDVESTVHEADDMGLNSKWKGHALKTGIASAAGGGVGAIVGAISGSLMTGSISGAIVGLVGGVANWVVDSYNPTEEYKYYVKSKLEEKGYKVIGWQKQLII